MNMLLLTFVILTIGYSVAWFAAYRVMRTERPLPMKDHSAPIETTTPEERARGERSFLMAEGREFGVTSAGFVSLVITGYVVLAVAFAVVSMFLRSSTI
jgi:hypothetical protein